MLTFKYLIEKKSCSLCVLNTHQSHKAYCAWFNVLKKNIQLLNYGGQESKKQFAGYDSNTLLTLKRGQGHQIWYDSVDPKQGYDSAKIEKHRLNSVRERADDAFLSNQTTRQISPMNTRESQKLWYSHDLPDVLNKPAKILFNLIRT